MRAAQNNHPCVVGGIGHIETGAYLGEAISGQAIVGNEKTVVLDVIELIARLQQTRFRELREFIGRGSANGGAPAAAELATEAGT